MGNILKKSLLKTSFVFTTFREKYYLSFLMAFLTHPLFTWAQENQQDTSSANLNKAQKSVFVELKKVSADDKNTIQSIIMIALVVLVVIIAMYLAFKGDPNEQKQGTYSRTPKKQI